MAPDPEGRLGWLPLSMINKASLIIMMDGRLVNVQQRRLNK